MPLRSIFLALVFAVSPLFAEDGITEAELANALKTLSLNPTVEIQKVLHPGDGGSIGVILKGGDATVLQFWIDGRLNLFDDHAKASGDLYIGNSGPGDSHRKQRGHCH